MMLKFEFFCTAEDSGGFFAVALTPCLMIVRDGAAWGFALHWLALGGSVVWHGGK